MEKDDIFDYGSVEAVEQVKVGVVGTSRRGLVDKAIAKELVESTLDDVARQHTNKELVLCSGGGLVPTLAFSWANRNDVQAVQVVSAAVRGHAKHAFERIEIGSSHGDVSDHFVGMIDVLVRIGGGAQSSAEVDLFRNSKPSNLVVEKDLPLLR